MALEAWAAAAADVGETSEVREAALVTLSNLATSWPQSAMLEDDFRWENSGVIKKERGKETI